MSAIRQDHCETRCHNAARRALNSYDRNARIAARLRRMDPDLTDWTRFEELLSGMENGCTSLENACTNVELLLAELGA